MRRLLAALGLGVWLSAIPLQAQAATVAIPPHYFDWGTCAWYAASVRPDVGAVVWGDPASWVAEAQQSGRTVRADPAPGTLAVYDPGVQGAAFTGHVARVLWVAPDGVHFTVDEMNFPWRGVVTTRTSQVGRGVSFIY